MVIGCATRNGKRLRTKGRRLIGGIGLHIPGREGRASIRY